MSTSFSRLRSNYAGLKRSGKVLNRLIAACVITFSLSAPFAATAAPVTIAALGDSLTQGYGLPPQDGFTAQLETWLESNDIDADVRNAGVSGDTTAGGLSRVDWTLTPDVDALIVALGGNDMLRGIDPSVSKENLRGILEAAQTQEVPVLLVGLISLGNYGETYKSAFEAMYPDLAQEFETLYFPNMLGPLAEMENREAAMRTYMQADGIHPNADGVALIVEALGPQVIQLAQKASEAP